MPNAANAIPLIDVNAPIDHTVIALATSPHHPATAPVRRVSMPRRKTPATPEPKSPRTLNHTSSRLGSSSLAMRTAAPVPTTPMTTVATRATLRRRRSPASGRKRRYQSVVNAVDTEFIAESRLLIAAAKRPARTMPAMPAGSMSMTKRGRI